MGNDSLQFTNTYPVFAKVKQDMRSKIYLSVAFANISLSKDHSIFAELNKLCKDIYLYGNIEILRGYGACRIEKIVLDNKFQLLFLRSGDLIILLNYILSNNSGEINKANYKKYFIPDMESRKYYHVKEIQVFGKMCNVINCYNAFIPYVKKMQGKSNDEDVILNRDYNESFFERFKSSLKFGDFEHEDVMEENNKLTFGKVDNIEGKQYRAYEFVPITTDSYMGENPHVGTGYRFEYLTCDSTCIITNYEKLL